MTLDNPVALAPAERAISLLGGDLTERALRLHLEGLSGVDAVGLEQRAADLGTRSIKTTSKAWALDRIIELIDLTTLEGADTPGKVRSLCAKAMTPDASDPSTPRVAAVCVYGDMVPYAVEALGAAHSGAHGGVHGGAQSAVLGDRHGAGRSTGPDRGITIAAVATAFPSGRASLRVKLADTADAVAAGADEIDMVIDRGAFLSGRYGQVFDEIVAVKEACRRDDGSFAHLKVILETGELNTYDNIRRASWLGILAGGDFIKTSTGKVAPAATLPVTLLMLEVVRDWRRLTGERIGVKPAGGIRTSKDAIKYLVTVAETVGEEWLTPSLFRFGASSLLNDVLLQRQKMTTGHYSGPDYVTVD
jgi:deoxyribose-phosphate aldolase